jgi:hypothetical protein
MVQTQPWQIVRETLSRKTLHKNRAGGVVQGEGPEFKPSPRTEKNNNKKMHVSTRHWWLTSVILAT